MLRDMRWYDDLDIGGLDTADESEMLEQDCYHVIIEALGSNLEDPTSGVGVDGALSGPTNSAFAADTEQQLATDIRVAGVQATLTDDGNGSLTLDVAIEPDPTQVDTTDTISVSVPIGGGQ